MRVNSASSFDLAIDALNARRSELGDAQTKLTTGKRVLYASDDPAAAARTERAVAAKARADANFRAMESSRNAMNLADGALADTEDLLQSIRELVVASGNGSYTDAERATLGRQIAGMRNQLLSVANRSDGANGYLFGGQGSSQPPFIDAPGGVQYVGDTGQLEVASGEPLPLTIDGRLAWLSARTGNGVFETSSANSTTAWIDAGSVTQPASLTGATYSVEFTVAAGATTYSVLMDGAGTAMSNLPYVSGQTITVDGMSFSIRGAPADGDSFNVAPSTTTLSVFDALDQTIADLMTPLATSSQRSQTTATGLTRLDSAMGNLQSTRAAVGEALGRADGVAGRLDDLKLQKEAERTSAQDLDMVAAISEFQNKQTGYDAALKSYALVQRMSLFQYLG